MRIENEIIYIDPFTMTLEEAKLVGVFLKYQGALIFEANEITPIKLPHEDDQYVIDANKIKKDLRINSIAFLYRLIKRERENIPNESIYDVYAAAEIQHKNSYSISVIGRIAYEQAEFATCKAQKRIAKRIYTSEEKVRRELFFSNQSKTLKMKRPIIYHRPTFSEFIRHHSHTEIGFKHHMLIMKEAAGVGLDKILEIEGQHRSNGVSYLNTDTKLYIAAAIARALDRQIHSHALVHCNLTEEQFLIDLNCFPYSATITGYQSAINAGETMQRSLSIIDKCYLAPEGFDNKQRSIETDIYSFANVLARLFDADKHPILKKIKKISNEVLVKKTLKLEKEVKKAASKRKFKHLLKHMPDLTVEQNNVLQFLLKCLIQQDKNARGNAQKLLKTIEYVLLQRELRFATNPQLKIEMELANFHAVELRLELDKLEDENKKLTAEGVAAYFHSFKNKLELVPDNPECFFIFRNRLHLSLLGNCDTKSELNVGLEELKLNMQSYFETLQKIIKRLEAKSLQLQKWQALKMNARRAEKVENLWENYEECQAELNILNIKLNYSLNLDNIAMVLVKLNKHLPQLIKNVAELSRQFEEFEEERRYKLAKKKTLAENNDSNSWSWGSFAAFFNGVTTIIKSKPLILDNSNSSPDEPSFENSMG